MGQMIDEEDCAVCDVFSDEWIFTYGDLVTLLLCFFILLFSMCKVSTSKFEDVANSFKPLPGGATNITDGNDAIVETIQEQVESSELADDTAVNVEDRGVVVSFSAMAIFAPGSVELQEAAKQELSRFARLLVVMGASNPNKLLLEGHADDRPVEGWPSAWELSGARAAAVARFLIQEGLKASDLNVKGFGSQRPRFRNDTDEQRDRNNRVEVIILPKGGI